MGKAGLIDVGKAEIKFKNFMQSYCLHLHGFFHAGDLQHKPLEMSYIE